MKIIEVADLVLLMDGGQNMWSLYKHKSGSFVITGFTGGLGQYEYAFFINKITDIINDLDEYYVSRLASDYAKLKKYGVEVSIKY